MSWDADGMSTMTELTWSPPAAGSKYGDQRRWRSDYRRRQLTVWQVAPEDDWYWQSAVSAGQVGRRRVPAVPGIAAQFHVLLCKSSRRPCNRSAEGCAANEARQWCGPRISYDRSAVRQRSVLTEDVKRFVLVAVYRNSVCPSVTLRGCVKAVKRVTEIRLSFYWSRPSWPFLFFPRRNAATKSNVIAHRDAHTGGIYVC